MKSADRLAVSIFIPLSLAFSAVGCSEQPKADHFEQLQARCIEDMVRQTCRLMNTLNTNATAEGDVLFVAGIGAVDPDVYAKLRAGGDQMCTHVVETCRAAWDGAVCVTARAIYGITKPVELFKQ